MDPVWNVVAYTCSNGCRYSAKHYDACPEHGEAPKMCILRVEIEEPADSKLGKLAIEKFNQSKERKKT